MEKYFFTREELRCGEVEITKPRILKVSGETITEESLLFHRQYLDKVVLEDCTIKGCRIYQRGFQTFSDCLMSLPVPPVIIIGCRFEDCDFKKVDFSVIKQSTFSNCHFTTSDFINAKVWKTDFVKCSFEVCDFQGSVFSESNLCNCEFSHSTFWPYRTVSTKVENPVCHNRALGFESLVPEKGSFIGFWGCLQGRIVELEICADSKRLGLLGGMCRCEKAKVLSITDRADSSKMYNEAFDGYEEDFVYRVGDIVSFGGFDEDRFNADGDGIRFFLSRQQAVEFSGGEVIK